MGLTVGEIFTKVIDAGSKDEKLNLLRQYNTPAVRTYLRMAFDDSVEVLLPKGPVPRAKNRDLIPEGFGENSLAVEAKRMYLFVSSDGAVSHQTLQQSRREILFLQMYESLDDMEQGIIVAVKDKNLDLGLTAADINTVIPGLIVKESNAVATPKKRGRKKKDS